MKLINISQVSRLQTPPSYAFRNFSHPLTVSQITNHLIMHSSFLITSLLLQVPLSTLAIPIPLSDNGLLIPSLPHLETRELFFKTTSKGIAAESASGPPAPRLGRKPDPWRQPGFKELPQWAKRAVLLDWAAKLGIPGFSPRPVKLPKGRPNFADPVNWELAPWKEDPSVWTALPLGAKTAAWSEWVKKSNPRLYTRTSSLGEAPRTTPKAIDSIPAGEGASAPIPVYPNGVPKVTAPWDNPSGWAAMTEKERLASEQEWLVASKIEASLPREDVAKSTPPVENAGFPPETPPWEIPELWETMAKEKRTEAEEEWAMRSHPS